MSQQIPVGTVLGGRYEITAQIIVTAETDMILDGMDQILSRKVSVVVASPARSNLLENNSRVLNESNPYSFQMLDMGITPEGSKYLITSYTAPSVLLDALLTEQRSLSDVYDDEAALGTEIFGATVPTQPAAMEVIGAIKAGMVTLSSRRWAAACTPAGTCMTMMRMMKMTAAAVRG